jgi:hypothetical protein
LQKFDDIGQRGNFNFSGFESGFKTGDNFAEVVVGVLMMRFWGVAYRFGLILIKIFDIIFKVLIEVGAFLIFFGVNRVDVVFHGFIYKAFIGRIEHGRGLKVTRYTFGAFLHVLYVVISVVTFVLRGEELR